MPCNLQYENVMKAELNLEFPAMLRSTRTTGPNQKDTWP